jgi:SAM-dependent methyltransferase
LEEREQTIGIARESLAAAVKWAEGRDPGDRLFTSTLGISDDERAAVLELARAPRGMIDPVAQFIVGATNGILYRDLIGKLTEYPIPNLRMSPGNGRRLLDVGCNWGRWSVAAARRGYRVVGIDPSLGAVLAARRVACQLGLDAGFVVGDARFLPFAGESFDAAFSYSVIQHFSKDDARLSFGEIGRILKPQGISLVQMPNRFGLRCLYHQARRGFRPTTGFEVRYWSLPELRSSFSSVIGPTELLVDCFFGIGLQPSDAHLMSLARRLVIHTSEFLRGLSESIPSLRYAADSVYASSVKRVPAE